MTEQPDTSPEQCTDSGLRTITMAFRTQKVKHQIRRKEREQNLQTKHPARIARLLAMAYLIEERLGVGKYRDYADVAQAHGFTRARVTQIMNLLLLSPKIQEEIINLEVYPGREPISEQHIRPVLRTMIWEEQEKIWERIVKAEKTNQ